MIPLHLKGLHQREERVHSSSRPGTGVTAVSILSEVHQYACIISTPDGENLAFFSDPSSDLLSGVPKHGAERVRVRQLGT